MWEMCTNPSPSRRYHIDIGSGVRLTYDQMARLVADDPLCPIPAYVSGLVKFWGQWRTYYAVNVVLY